MLHLIFTIALCFCAYKIAGHAFPLVRNKFKNETGGLLVIFMLCNASFCSLAGLHPVFMWFNILAALFGAYTDCHFSEKYYNMIIDLNQDLFKLDDARKQPEYREKTHENRRQAVNKAIGDSLAFRDTLYNEMIPLYQRRAKKLGLMKECC